MFVLFRAYLWLFKRTLLTEIKYLFIAILCAEMYCVNWALLFLTLSLSFPSYSFFLPLSISYSLTLLNKLTSSHHEKESRWYNSSFFLSFFLHQAKFRRKRETIHIAFSLTGCLLFATFLCHLYEAQKLCKINDNSITANSISISLSKVKRKVKSFPTMTKSLIKIYFSIFSNCRCCFCCCFLITALMVIKLRLALRT